MVWSKLIWSVVILIITILGYISHRSNERLPLSVEQIDTLALYFSGELDVTSSPHTFKDCATLSTFPILYNKGVVPPRQIKGRGYCQLRGYKSNQGAIVVHSLGEIRGRSRCLGISLCNHYQANSDTLILNSDYSWQIRRKNKKRFVGRWAKLYYNQGVLLIDGKVYPFTINYGTLGSQYRTVLSFKDFNNKTFNFIPL